MMRLAVARSSSPSKFRTSKAAHSSLKMLINEALASLSPPPNLTISEWADEYRILSQESSAESGQWNTDRFPAQRGIMDAISDSANDKVVIQAGAQWGKTEIINNVVGYYMDKDPSNMLIVQPTLSMAETWSKDRLAPMIRDTPVLTKACSEAKGRGSDNTIFRKAFKGGQLAIVGAESPVGLASRPVRIVLFDEVDRFPVSAGTEGDPVMLGEKRTQTYWNSIIVMVSTPTTKGHSRIETAFNETDKRYYFVPCPYCNHKQTLRWANVRWEEGKPEICEYMCESCGTAIPHSKKAWMVKNGEWIPTAKPIRKGLVGFHISELYSPWSSWSSMAGGFLEAKKSSDTLRTWINTSLGETFEEQGEKLDGVDLYNKREKYEKVPDRAVVLTGAIDTQDNRLELSIYAHCPNNEAYAIDHIIAYGNVAEDGVWNEMEKILDTRWERESGGFATMSRIGVDTQGHHTTMAYKFCSKLSHKGVMALQGHSTPNKPAISRPKLLHHHQVNLYTVGTDTIKDNIFARLQIESGQPHCIHFPWHFDPEIFAQLTSEKRVTAYRHGVPYSKYIKTRDRNEALDLLVYNIAVLTSMNIDLDTASPIVVDGEGQHLRDLTVTTKASTTFVGRHSSWFRR